MKTEIGDVCELLNVSKIVPQDRKWHILQLEPVHTFS
ncbi:hypothetical protein NPIL_447321, partial [Nephila pilipes]